MSISLNIENIESIWPVFRESPSTTDGRKYTNSHAREKHNIFIIEHDEQKELIAWRNFFSSLKKKIHKEPFPDWGKKASLSLEGKKYFLKFSEMNLIEIKGSFRLREYNVFAEERIFPKSFPLFRKIILFGRRDLSDMTQSKLNVCRLCYLLRPLYFFDLSYLYQDWDLARKMNAQNYQNLLPSGPSRTSRKMTVNQNNVNWWLQLSREQGQGNVF